MNTQKFMETLTPKFIIVVLISAVMLATGVALIFMNKSSEDRTVGVGFITSVFGTWVNVSTDKNKIKSFGDLEEVVVPDKSNEVELNDKGKSKMSL